jgi:hypothetical protein
VINGNELDVCTHHAGIGRTGFCMRENVVGV